MFPEWLIVVAWICLAIAVICSAIIAIDVLRHPQHMMIMNIVWPVTALYSGPIGLWAYFRFGRLSTHEAMQQAKAHDQPKPSEQKPKWATYALATTHCGSGCALGDLIAEWGVFFFPIILVWLGYHTLWDHKMFSTWILDFVCAFLLGVAFQYFTIVPMKHLSKGEGLLAALKADTASLTAWQVGMYGWMAIATLAIFGRELPKTSPVFWFMMQIAMLAGFLTALPVNVWLVRQGIKEKM
jgi:hypothetical protein